MNAEFDDTDLGRGADACLRRFQVDISTKAGVTVELRRHHRHHDERGA